MFKYYKIIHAFHNFAGSKEIREFETLEQAVKYIGWYSISEMKNNRFVHGFLRYSEEYITDELDLKVPQWKLIEVSKQCGVYYDYYHYKSYRKKKFKFRSGPVENINNRKWHRHYPNKASFSNIRKIIHLKEDSDIKDYKINIGNENTIYERW
jgi:hypothetical protein